jgi:hypothetical protein
VARQNIPLWVVTGRSLIVKRTKKWASTKAGGSAPTNSRPWSRNSEHGYANCTGLEEEALGGAYHAVHSKSFQPGKGMTFV